MAKHLITSAVVDTEDDDALVYVKGYQKRKWYKTCSNTMREMT